MELKFRAWDKEDKVMREVESIIKFDGDGHYLLKSPESFYGLSFGANNKRAILMQCTGIRDCESDLIYVGDIVKYNHDEYIVVDENGFMLIRLDNEMIDYNDFPQSIYPRGSDETEFSGVMNDYCVSFYELICNEEDFEGCLSCEVIGNIYENKEMMEGFEI